MSINGKLIFDAINEARLQPGSVLQQVKFQLGRFETSHILRNKKDDKVRTLSGKSAWQDCILSLQRQKAKSKYQWSDLLEKAANLILKTKREGSKVSFSDSAATICKLSSSPIFLIQNFVSSDSAFEIATKLIVGDSDQRKQGRCAIFHPLYRFCGGIVEGSQLCMIFSETVGPPAESGQTMAQMQSAHFNQPSNHYHEKPPIESPIKPANHKDNLPPQGQPFISFQPQNPNKDFWNQGLRLGSVLITELNRIRKQPKQYVHFVKSYMEKFNQDNSVKTDHGNITTKEGKGPYQQLISDIQQMYPLPSVKQSVGLAQVALDLAKPIIDSSYIKIQFEDLVSKHLANVEGIKCLKHKGSGIDVPILILNVLGGDGDKKRVARKKLLSPVIKAVGGWIGPQLCIINVADLVKEKPRTSQIEAPQRHQQSRSNNFHQTPKYINESDDKCVMHKVSHSSIIDKNGRKYKVTSTHLTYINGRSETIRQEELIS